MVMNFCPSGDLWEYMGVTFPDDIMDATPRGRSLSPSRLETARIVVSQMASAVYYLQTVQVAHRDIKPENIMVLSPTKFQLGDFGWVSAYLPLPVCCVILFGLRYIYF